MAGSGWSRVGAGVVAGLVLGGGLALAAIPHGETGQISACYATGGAASGRLRVIDREAGEHCTSGEAPLSWNRGIRWRGAWKPARSYEVGDAVSRNGSSYLATSTSTGKDPASSPGAWGALAQRGAAGPAAKAVDIVLAADQNAGVELGDGLRVDVECEGTPPHELYVYLGSAPNGSAAQVEVLRSHNDVDEVHDSYGTGLSPGDTQVLAMEPLDASGWHRAIGTMIIDGGGLDLRTFTFDAFIDERPLAGAARCRLHGAVVTAT